MPKYTSRQRLEECVGELDRTIEACESRIEENINYLRAHYPYFDKKDAIKKLKVYRQVLGCCTLARDAAYRCMPELKQKEEIVRCDFF